jgi:hypothetical protein
MRIPFAGCVLRCQLLFPVTDSPAADPGFGVGGAAEAAPPG